MMRRAVLLSALLSLAAFSRAAEPQVSRTWRGRAGEFEIKATLVDVKYDKVAKETLATLQKDDGRKIDVSVQKLTDEDRAQVQRFETLRRAGTDPKAGGAQKDLKKEPPKQPSPAKKAVRGPLPAGAKALRYTKCVIDERPVAEDVTAERTGDHKWFSGQWWMDSQTPPERYKNDRGKLALSLGGDLVSAPRDFSPGKLPYLSGAEGFYVEFDVQLSDDDPDHFPAVWLMPIEHNREKADHYPDDPDGFERWMELDVDEGGFAPGVTGTVHSSTGIWPDYKHIQNPNNTSEVPLRRRTMHTFGAGYDPKRQAVSWWLDGKGLMQAGAPHVPDVGAKQHFYLIISAQTHGKNKPYTMFIGGVRAFVPPTSTLPAVE